MPRIPRGYQTGYIYHVLNRGNGRQTVFRKDADYRIFLRLMREGRKRIPVRILSYCLMPNHFHFLVMPGSANALSQWMQWLMTSHVRRYHQHHRTSGHVWQGRFKSFVIQDGKYILECGRYIELNPVRAGIVEKAENYPWTSAGVYLKAERNPLVDYNPEYLGLSDKQDARCRIYGEYLLDGIKDRRKLDRYFKTNVYGSKKFIDTMKSAKGLKPVWSHKGRPKKKRTAK